MNEKSTIAEEKVVQEREVVSDSDSETAPRAVRREGVISALSGVDNVRYLEYDEDSASDSDEDFDFGAVGGGGGGRTTGDGTRKRRRVQ